jgi:hypothetical protein
MSIHIATVHRNISPAETCMILPEHVHEYTKHRLPFDFMKYHSTRLCPLRPHHFLVTASACVCVSVCLCVGVSMCLCLCVFVCVSVCVSV